MTNNRINLLNNFLEEQINMAPGYVKDIRGMKIIDFNTGMNFIKLRNI